MEYTSYKRLRIGMEDFEHSQGSDRRHGAWIPYYGAAKCGECGALSITDKYKYCPFCGAVMDRKFGSDLARKLYEKISANREIVKKIQERYINGGSKP